MGADERKNLRELVVAFARIRLRDMGKDRTLALKCLAGPDKAGKVLVEMPNGEIDFFNAVIELLDVVPVRAEMSAPKGELSRRFRNLEID